MSVPLAVGGLIAGSGLLYAGMNGYFTSKTSQDVVIPEFAKPFLEFVDESTVKNICLDSTWSELCDRAADFAIIAKEEFTELLLAVGDAVEYQQGIETQKIKLSHGSPRIYRKYMHAVIEAVRCMRAAIEHKFSSSLDDFDEIAADIQRTHDDYCSNMLLEAQAIL
jgi:hypothetical protein